MPLSHIPFLFGDFKPLISHYLWWVFSSLSDLICVVYVCLLCSCQTVNVFKPLLILFVCCTHKCGYFLCYFFILCDQCAKRNAKPINTAPRANLPPRALYQINTHKNEWRTFCAKYILLIQECPLKETFANMIMNQLCNTYLHADIRAQRSI